jgi:adenylate cyclase
MYCIHERVILKRFFTTVGSSVRVPPFFTTFKAPWARPGGARGSLALIAALAVLLAAWPQWRALPAPAATADAWLRDRLLVLHASDAPETRILVVDIDEASLAAQPWPWPRARLADLVEALLANGAAGVALDIFLEKPADAGGDARLAGLAEHGPLVLAQLLDFGHRSEPLRGGVLLGGQPAAAGDLPAASGYLANHAGLARARHAGNIGVLPDADGILRQMPLHAYYQGRSYAALAPALFNCCARPSARASAAADAGAGLTPIAYRRNWAAYDVARATEVLDGTVGEADIRGRLVLLGSSSLSIGDRIATPLGGATAGLLVHAAMLTELLDRQAGSAPAPWPGRWLALLYAAAVALLALVTLPRLSAASNAALLAGAAALWLLLAYAISPHDARFSISAPLVSALFLLGVGVPFQWQQSQRKSHRLLGTLRQYVASAVVDELLRSDLKDPLAPRLLQVTTLVADMEGYTTQVESLSLEDAARLTAEFLDCLTGPVIATHGTLDKYTGDGLVAFWGAPLPDADHADRALDAAAAIVRAVAALSARRAAAGKPRLRVRIGVESGAAMAGDYGSSFRSIYTAVGDSVNTASRLEQAARDYPHDIIVGDGAVARARRHRFMPLGERQLRGKEKIIKVYTLAAAEQT